MNDPRRPVPRARIASALALAVGIGCDLGPKADPPRSAPRLAPATQVVAPAREGVSDLQPGATLPTAAGQSIYLPVRTRVAAEDGRPIKLAVNVAVLNADESRPIIVTLLRHRDADGRTVVDYLHAPVRLAAKATLDVVLKDLADSGASSSVLVEWVADRPVAPPVVEAVMIGTSGSQGISFTSHGRVIDDRQKPASPPR